MRKLISTFLILTICVGMSMSVMAGCSRLFSITKSVPVFGERRHIQASIYMIGRNKRKLEKAYNEIIDGLKSIDNEISTVKDISFIYTFNNSTGLDEVGNLIDYPIDGYNHVLPLIKRAQEFYNETGKDLGFERGLFNPAIYPLMELWNLDANSLYAIDQGIMKESEAVKDAHQAIQDGTISDILEATNFDKVIRLKQVDGKHYLNKLNPAAKLDFGGQAKGYGANLAIDIADKYGILRTEINIGGNIAAKINLDLLSNKEREEVQGFNIGITKPCPKSKTASSARFATFSLGNHISAVTSGDYERNFAVGEEGDQVYYAHILDPRTGYPLNLNVTKDVDNTYHYSNNVSGLTSVTIFDPDSEKADVFAKVVILLGMEDGIKFLEDNNMRGVLISHDKVYAAVGDLTVTPRADSLYMSDYTPYSAQYALPDTAVENS